MDKEYWRTVYIELIAGTIGECKFQFVWNHYCDETLGESHKIVANDRDFFLEKFSGCSVEYIYDNLMESDYDLLDNWARATDGFDCLSSANCRFHLVSPEEWKDLEDWVKYRNETEENGTNECV